ncbi:MAG TPA: hypothetical protein DCQ92_01155 [Verrucomicrobia subdivision 3 bacterium]|nr:hypothetical protein [Limisphaerales bacterium]
MRSDFPVCADLPRFCAGKIPFARTESALRAEKPVCAGILHFARAFSAFSTPFSTCKRAKRDSCKTSDNCRGTL